jgi:flavoprotein
MIDISVHNITGIAIDTPSVDHNWIQFTIINKRGEECEVTMFLQQYGDDKVTLYEFLHDLRDSTERAIKELISVQQSQSED